jgi:photosystem I subunit 11
MADVRDRDIIGPFNGDPFTGHLSTPISDSDIRNTFINNLPLYRKGLSPLLRGLEIGMAHGYFLVGPETLLGPLRETEVASIGGLITAIALVLIATAGMAAYGIAWFQESDGVPEQNPQTPEGVPAFGEPMRELGRVPEQNPKTPEELRTAEGWSQFVGGFFVGAAGSAFVAYFLLENFDVVDSIFRGIVNNT